MLVMGIKKLSSNLGELERRLIELQKAEAFVGVTVEDGIHEESDMSYVDLHYMHHMGFTTEGGKYVPARPVTTVLKLTYGNTEVLRKGLDRYFGKLDKRSPVSVEDVLTPWLTGMLSHVQNNIFGNPLMLEENSQYTINLKGKNTPLVDSGDLKGSWKIRINGKVVK